MILKELNLGKRDKQYLGLIIAISSILTLYYLIFSMNIGIFCSDVYVYLVNALFYAGKNVNANKDMWLTPLTCILTSFLFDVGLKNQVSIFIVTGILAIIGNVGLYLLFRLKFNKVLSFLGVVIYSTFSLNLIWLANGSLDIPAVSLTIWTVLFGIIAIDKNPKYYLWTIVMFLLAFLVRYTVVLILPVLLLYFIYRKKYEAPWNELKYLVIPVVSIGIMSAVVMAIIFIKTGELTMLTTGLGFLGGEQGSKANPAYNLNVFYYIANFFNFLGSSNVTFFDVEFFKGNPQLNNPTIISIAYGIILIVGGLIALKDNIKGKFSKKYLVGTIVCGIITFIFFMKLETSLTIFFTFITMIFARKIFRSSKYDLSLMLLSWLLINLLFFSIINFKVNRYFIPCLPTVAYFIVYGIYKIQEKVKINKFIIPIVLTVILLFSAFTFTLGVEETDVFKAPQEMGDYIVQELPDYKDKNVASNTIRPYKWYLEQRIFAIKNSDLDRLEEFNITYYISNNKLDNLENYSEIKNIDGVYLYKKNPS
ncbi:MAG: glycosyltransferase family 39 protein [Methanobrevibacter sp.]|uniref:glycosyltransferase family 39 protein n=1 Tax=Methanobrevibacter sp. TaxID=66852 RepID=UPI0026DFC8F0|nr:glycosyltransferase family 39 protein [Methanobrevibacter sp.]MDO5848215.1 glycosyltransferase family 39 protein [Methanobrevibacter sp.]